MISKSDFKNTVRKYSEEDCNSPFSTEHLNNISKLFKEMSEDKTVEFIKDNIEVLTKEEKGYFSDAIENIYVLYQTHSFSQKLNKAIGHIDNEDIQEQLEHIELISMPDDEA